MSSVFEAVGRMMADGRLDAYLPVHDGKPLFPDSFFVRASSEVFSQLMAIKVPGLTPYYNADRSGYVRFSDNQIDMLRTIVDSMDPNILVDQTVVPTYLDGDMVEVVDSTFKGVVGRYFKYKGQHRVFVEIPGLGVFGTSYVPRGMVRMAA